MKTHRLVLKIVLLACVTLSGGICAPLAAAQGVAPKAATAPLLLQPGNTLTDIQIVYHPNLPIRSNSAAPPAVVQQVHLQNDGIWFFLKNNVIESIRLERPFRDGIWGIHIGDSKQVVLKKLGSPVTETNPTGRILASSILYHGLHRDFIRYYLDASGLVSSILIFQ